MASYYTLMTEVPPLKLGGEPLGISTHYIRQQLEEEMSASDRKVLDTFFLKYDALNVARMLQDPNAELDDRGLLGRETLRVLITGEETLEDMTACVPDFLKQLVQAYPEEGRQKGYFVEDAALLAYYDYARRTSNAQVAKWCTLNYNVQCIMTALIARQHGWVVADYVKGEGELCDQLRSSQEADFGLSIEVPYLSQLREIAAHTDPVEKERQLDAFKWLWLDDETFMDGFNTFAVFAYLARLEMMERWARLDVEKGKARFQEIIENLRGEARVPDEFKR